MAGLLWRKFEVLHPRIARVFTNGSGFAGESHYRFYSCFFAKCVVEMWSEVGSAAGRGGPQRSRGGKENPSRHRQLLKEMISSWLGVTGVRAEEMTKSRKI
jgi:hypothetical protein